MKLLILSVLLCLSSLAVAQSPYIKNLSQLMQANPDKAQDVVKKRLTIEYDLGFRNESLIVELLSLLKSHKPTQYQFELSEIKKMASTKGFSHWEELAAIVIEIADELSVTDSIRLISFMDASKKLGKTDLYKDLLERGFRFAFLMGESKYAQQFYSSYNKNFGKAVSGNGLFALMKMQLGWLQGSLTKSNINVAKPIYKTSVFAVRLMTLNLLWLVGNETEFEKFYEESFQSSLDLQRLLMLKAKITFMREKGRPLYDQSRHALTLLKKQKEKPISFYIAFELLLTQYFPYLKVTRDAEIKTIYLQIAEGTKGEISQVYKTVGQNLLNKNRSGLTQALRDALKKFKKKSPHHAYFKWILENIEKVQFLEPSPKSN